MLSFFRQLRQKLLTQNRVGKYLVYAVGEIVLVVIGILIALQVNSWAERRREESLYFTYLVRLKSDSENLLDRIRLATYWENEMVELTRYQLDFLNGGLNDLDTLKLAVSVEFTAGINPYSLHIPTYSELESTGRLVLIESESLKQELADFQQYTIQRMSNKAEWDPWVFKYRAMARNLLHSEDRIRINDLWAMADDSTKLTSSWFRAYFNGKDSIDLTLKTNKKNFTRDLLNIEGLPGLVTDIYISRSITRILLIDEKANTLKLIKMIQDEIDRIKDP